MSKAWNESIGLETSCIPHPLLSKQVILYALEMTLPFLRYNCQVLEHSQLGRQNTI
jgi:hypothetical protein